MLFRKSEREGIPLGERNVAIPFWMASKQFIPGRAAIQKHQRIHFLLLNPDYIVEIFRFTYSSGATRNNPLCSTVCSQKGERHREAERGAPLSAWGGHILSGCTR